MRAISIRQCSGGKGLSALSPNQKRRLARVVIWSVAASALVVELSYLAVSQLA